MAIETKVPPPTCKHNKQGCSFSDLCDNWGDDDGTDNDSNGHDGHEECNNPDGP